MIHIVWVFEYLINDVEIFRIFYRPRYLHWTLQTFKKNPEELCLQNRSEPQVDDPYLRHKVASTQQSLHLH